MLFDMPKLMICTYEHTNEPNLNEVKHCCVPTIEGLSFRKNMKEQKNSLNPS